MKVIPFVMVSKRRKKSKYCVKSNPYFPVLVNRGLFDILKIEEFILYSEVVLSLHLHMVNVTESPNIM